MPFSVELPVRLACPVIPPRLGMTQRHDSGLFGHPALEHKAALAMTMGPETRLMHGSAKYKTLFFAYEGKVQDSSA